MIREPLIITEPTIEPVSTSDFKDHKRIDIGDEDATVIPDLLKAARLLFERHTGRTLHQTTYDAFLDDWPSGSCPILLPRAAPLISVTGVYYLDDDGTEQTWATTEWISSTRTLPGRVAPAYGEQYPTATLYPLSPIRVRYVAGIANASPQTYPDDRIRIAIMEIAGSMYELREAEYVTDNWAGLDVSKLTFGAQALINSCRVSFL